MAWRCGSVSRSMISRSRTSSIRSSLPRLRPSPPPLHSPRLQSRRSLFTIPSGSTSVADAAAQRGGRRSPHLAHFNRIARLLRAFSGYLTELLDQHTRCYI